MTSSTDTPPAELTTAAQVVDALARKWPDGDYLHIPEAPTSADRGGRKLDILVLSTWRSRGFEREGVEVKVSVADWRREFLNPAKADWWFGHCHRFWLAAPTKVAEKILPEVPESWGVLACAADAVKVLRKAPKHAADPLPTTAWVGLLRASAGAGRGALDRAESRGHTRGYQAGKEAGRNSVQQSQAAGALADLRRRIDEFTAASGVDPREPWNGTEAGRAFKLALDWTLNPTAALDRLLTTAGKLDAEARKFEKLAKGVYDDLVPEHPNRDAADQLDRVTRMVLERHADDGDGECAGCGLDSTETPYPWPCRELAELRRATGRALPDVDDEALHREHPTILTGQPSHVTAIARARKASA